MQGLCGVTVIRRVLGCQSVGDLDGVSAANVLCARYLKQPAGLITL